MIPPFCYTNPKRTCTFTLFIHIKATASYLTEDDYSNAILLFSVFSYKYVWVITLMILLNLDNDSNITFTHFWGYIMSYYIPIYFILSFKRASSGNHYQVLLAHSHGCSYWAGCPCWYTGPATLPLPLCWSSSLCTWWTVQPSSMGYYCLWMD